MKTSLFLSTALTALLVTGMASAAKTSYIAPELEGSKEVPTAVESAATAEARFTYDDVTKKLCGHIKTTPGTFAATAAHIHAGDDKTAGPPKIAFEAFTGTLKVNQVLTTEEAAALEEDTYVNLHTTLNPNGELRDQLLVDDRPDEADEVCEGDDADAGTTPKGDSGTGTGASSSSTSSSGTTATPAATDDGGCNTSGSSNTGSGIAIAAGLGLVLAAASRKRNKKA